MITAVIIARNSSRTISDCVSALRFCDRIVVGENNSQDQTASLAEAAGAEVQSVAWQGYGRTKNELLKTITQGWVLSVDADEVVTPDLAAEIQQAVVRPEPADGYFLRRENYFLGHHIRHCGWSPDFQLRLFRAGQGRFEEKQVHEALRVSGRLERLQQALRHDTYANVEEYLSRMNLYTSLAAQDRLDRGKSFSGLRLVFDPFWTFAKMYGLKQGWRDGFPGLALCALSALNTLVKHAKHWELSRPGRSRG